MSLLCTFALLLRLCLVIVFAMPDEVRPLPVSLDSQSASYEEVKSIPQHPEKFLIEVRSRDEVADTGEIPGSVIIPLPELEQALMTSGNDFEMKYGRSKPKHNDIIIFTCRSGRRAETAKELANKLGFSSVRVYHGSWLEWSEKSLS